jgi:hypothetical protein
MSKAITPEPKDLLTWPVELLRFVGAEEAERLSGLSWDTIKREHGDKVVQLSTRRVGMRVGHALMLVNNA